MPDLEGVKPGDQLVKMYRYGGQHNNTDEPEFVRVHKVGPTYIHVLRQDGRPEFGTDRYRRTTGVLGDGTDLVYLITPEEFEDVTGRRALEEAMRQHGFTFPSDKFSLDVLRGLVNALIGETCVEYGVGYSGLNLVMHVTPDRDKAAESLNAACRNSYASLQLVQRTVTHAPWEPVETAKESKEN